MTIWKLKAPILATLALAGTCPVAAQSSPKAKGVKPLSSISITLRAVTVKSSGAVNVDVSLTNKASVTMRIYRMNEVPYYVDVKEANGTFVPLTDRGRAWKRYLDESARLESWGDFVDIEAGETFKDQVVVSDVYDMSKPGAYTIQFFTGPPGRSMVANSNIVTVTVIR